MKMQRVGAALLAMVVCGAIPPLAKAQSSSGAGSSTGSASQTSAPSHVQPGSTYSRPTGNDRLKHYLFDSFGPYALIGAAAAAGINQASGDRYFGEEGEHLGSGSPPEWGGGAGPYFERFASNLGINLTANTYRYGVGALLHEDTAYYRCDCTGFGHRLGHAIITTVEARHGDDGHYRFSFVNLSAPYAGTMTAALGWYPDRYNASDGFRMGNYVLATAVGINIAKEFIYGGPHTLMGHMHHHSNP